MLIWSFVMFVWWNINSSYLGCHNNLPLLFQWCYLQQQWLSFLPNVLASFQDKVPKTYFQKKKNPHLLLRSSNNILFGTKLSNYIFILAVTYQCFYFICTSLLFSILLVLQFGFVLQHINFHGLFNSEKIFWIDLYE